MESHPGGTELEKWFKSLNVYQSVSSTCSWPRLSFIEVLHLLGPTSGTQLKRRLEPLNAFWKSTCDWPRLIASIGVLYPGHRNPSGIRHEALYYRARGPIGFLKFKKVVISIHLFLIEKKTQKFSMHLSGLLWPKFCTNFCSWFFLESKYCQNHGQCSENVEGGLSKGWFFSWWKFRPSGEKSSK